MRTGRYYFFDAIVIQRLNVLVGHHLEHKFIPRPAKLIPTLVRMVANALVIFCARWSKLPEQPTQNKISGVAPAAVISATVRICMWYTGLCASNIRERRATL